MRTAGRLSDAMWDLLMGRVWRQALREFEAGLENLRRQTQTLKARIAELEDAYDSRI